MSFRIQHLTGDKPTVTVETAAEAAFLMRLDLSDFLWCIEQHGIAETELHLANEIPERCDKQAIIERIVDVIKRAYDRVP